MLIIFMFGGLVGFLSNFGTNNEVEPEPYQGYRRTGQRIISKLGRAITFVMGFHHIKTKGKLASSKEAPVVVIAPHSHFMDGPITAGLGSLTFMSRKENDLVPIIGQAVRALQPIYVKREKRSSKDDTVKEIRRRAQAVGAWPPICVFPEGTCTNGECLITFKTGAFSAGVPVQPVLYRYQEDFYLKCGSWTWISPPTWKLLVSLLTRINNVVEIEYLPVYKPNEEERANAILYANNVRKVMASALGVPTFDHSFEDCRLMLEAHSKGLPMEAGLVEYSKISLDLGLNTDRLKELLGHFANIDINKDGLVTFDEFSVYLCSVDKETARSIFKKIDKGQRGFIDFKTFVYGVTKEEFPEFNFSEFSRNSHVK
eukprot:gene1018-15343_t